MGTIKMSGIIISENNLGDYDKMLTMLTPGLGKISCVAKGARRQKSALLAGTQFLCFGEYLMYKGANTYNINSCETIEVFYNLRTDLDKLNYAVEITKIIRDVTDENENCYKILQLFLNTLYTLSETDKNPELIMSIFTNSTAPRGILQIVGSLPRQPSSTMPIKITAAASALCGNARKLKQAHTAPSTTSRGRRKPWV